MRSILVWLGLCTPLAAAPVPAPAPAAGKAAREQLHAEALNYGQQLLNVSTQVSLNYVRTVSRADLLAAAWPASTRPPACRSPPPSRPTCDGWPTTGP